MKKIFLALILSLSIVAPQHINATWSDVVIVLDPGHGGDDPGACYASSSVNNYTEAWLVLQCASNVYNTLSGLGANVYMTRFENDFSGEVDLSPRRAFCYTYNSDVFVSFHLNAANASAHGTETYYSADYSSNSYSLAYAMQTALISRFSTVDGTGGYELIDRGVKSANYTVITAGEAYPSILTESLFVDCYSDWQLIQDTSSTGFFTWVDAHLQGIYDYVTTYEGYSVTEPSYFTGGGGSSSSTPYIDVSSNEVTLTCEAGKSVSTQVTVKGNKLNGWCYITVEDADGVFTVNPTGLTVDGYPNYNFVDGEPVVTITFSPKVAGNYLADTDASNTWNERFVTFNSVDVDGNDVYQWIALNGIATEPTSENPVDPEPGTTITPTTDVISGLTEVWNYSEKSGNTADWITNGSQVTQDMAFANGKLYVVHRNGGNSDNKIYIVDAFNGAQIGTLDVSPCTTGTYYLSSIEAIGGKIIASNLAASATSQLNVYLWDNDAATPTTLLSTTSHCDVRAGDAMSVSGNLSNGRIWFAYGSKVYYYTIANGAVVSTEPTVINLTKSGSEFAISSTSATPNITVESDGSFWVSSKDYVAAHFAATGEWIEDLSLDIIGNKQGTDLKILNLGSKKYVAATKYLNTTDATNGLTDAAFMLMDVTNGVSSATAIGTYPQTGLGTSRNTSFRNTICFDIDNQNLNLWVLAPFQGATYYKFQHSSTVGIDDIACNEKDFRVLVGATNIEIKGIEVADVEIYSISGVLVAKEANTNVNISSLASGIYIVKATDVNGYTYTAKISLK
ncbi:MAG: N-acetylmuramoyl-L-alanine amidase [Muribaculaceae bacterium]|nr:N-acetylmuramoyl-L-alanine amidase [Muribaculaceae bacterium]